MTSKYWTSNKSSASKELLDAEKEKAEADDSTSCGDSVQEIATGKANMKNFSSDGRTKNFTSNVSTSSSSAKPRPDSLKLSFDYGSSSDLAKSANSSSDVNQSKSLSVARNISHHDGKKPMSYDLWVNENVDRNENASTVEKKLDLPGRVSFRYGTNIVCLFCFLIREK